MKSKLGRNILSGAGAIGGVFFLLFGLLVMNGLEGMKKDKSGKKTTAFKVAPPKQKKKQASVAKPKPKPKKKSRPKVAPPALAGAGNGASFGLEQFEFLADAGDGLLGTSKKVIMTEDTVDIPPKARYRAPLDYPSNARKRSIEGFVILNMLIGTEGQVEQVKVLEAEPQGIFDQVAMSSAGDWQFEAASYQGKKVKVWVRQRITFNLN
jgi:protein TonB